MKRWGALVGLVFMLGACSSSSTSAGPHFDTPAKLAAALGSKGMTCKYEKDSSDVSFGAKPVSRGTCTIEDEDVKIEFYKDRGVTDNIEGFAKTLGCSFAKGFGYTSLNYVRGDVWIVTPESETLNKKLAKALGTTPRHVKC